MDVASEAKMDEEWSQVKRGRRGRRETADGIKFGLITSRRGMELRGAK